MNVLPDDSRAELETLKSAIERRGYFGSIQPIEEDGDEMRLVCATDGIGGKSLWVAKEDGRWIICTWRPQCFIVPADRDICSLIDAAIRTFPANYATIDAQVIDEYALVPIERW